MNIYNGYTRIIGVIPEVYVGNPLKNSISIMKAIDKYTQYKPGCIVFPELSLTGYTCGDLFTTQSLQQEVKESLKNLVNYIRNIDSIHSCLYIIGAPLYIENGLYNVAIVLGKQGILGIIPKKYLANDHEFYEKRWFINHSNIISQKIYMLEFQNEAISFGTNFIFQPTRNSDFMLGVEICRDLWVTDSPSHDLIKAGATVIVNISASNDTVGKKDYRRDLVRMQSAKQRSVYMYVNTSYNESTADTIYSGHSIIAENGEILTETSSFSWKENSIIADVDLELIKHERIRYAQDEFAYKPVHIVYYENDIENIPFPYLLRTFNKYPFINQDDEKQKKCCKEILDIQIAALRHRLLAVKPEEISLGVSGGLDSTLVLCVLYYVLQTFDVTYKPKINLMYLQGYGSTENSLDRSIRLLKLLNYKLNIISIKKNVLEMLKSMNHNPFDIPIHEIDTCDDLQIEINNLIREGKPLKDVVFENVQARIRTNILMNSGFMLGTSDLSEIALGFSTYGGDHASMYNVNCGIPKTLVKEMLIYLRDVFDDYTDVFNQITYAPISPELIPNQTTIEELGKYEIFDFIMYYFLKHGFSQQKILYIAKQVGWYDENNYSYINTKSVFMNHLRIFFQRFYDQQYKRNFLPDGPKILDFSLSPRTDWRMPDDIIK